MVRCCSVSFQRMYGPLEEVISYLKEVKAAADAEGLEVSLSTDYDLVEFVYSTKPSGAYDGVKFPKETDRG